MLSRYSTLFLSLLLAPLAAPAQGPAYRLIEGEVPAVSAPTDTRLLTTAGDRLFFVGTSPSTGTEVWTSDGSPEGTHLVRDIFPGPDVVSQGGIPEMDYRLNPTPGPLGSLGGAVFFAATDGTSRCLLWRSDGTSAGTAPVVDPGRPDVPVIPCISLNLGNKPVAMISSGGRLFFRATRGTDGALGLWSTDGTEAGTRYLAPIETLDGQIHALDVSGVLAFQGYDPVHGYGLWRSDGTPEGTRLVVTLGGPILTMSARGRSIVVESGSSDISAYRLWLVDLESGSAMLLRNLQWGVTGIAWSGRTIVFSVHGVGDGDGLWSSDGTLAGTARVSSVAGASGLATAGDVIVGSSAAGLFMTDGTTDGTKKLGSFKFVSAPVTVGREVWFAARDAQSVLGVWRSDGTEAGTRLVARPSTDPEVASRSSLRSVTRS